MFLAILLLFFLANRRYKTISFTAVFSVIILGLSFTFDKGGNWTNFLNFLPQTSYGQYIEGLFSPANKGVFSLASFFARLTNENIFLVKILAYVSVVALLAVLFFYYYKKKKNTNLLLLPLMIIMIVAAPYAYIHHIVYLFPALVIYFAELADDKVLKSGKISNFPIDVLVIFALVLLSSIDFPKYFYLLYANGFFNKIAAALHYSYNLYFLLLLFFMSLLVRKND